MRRGTVCLSGFSRCLKYSISIEGNRATPSGLISIEEGEVMDNLEAWEEADD